MSNRIPVHQRRGPRARQNTVRSSAADGAGSFPCSTKQPTARKATAPSCRAGRTGASPRPKKRRLVSPPYVVSDPAHERVEYSFSSQWQEQADMSRIRGTLAQQALRGQAATVSWPLVQGTAADRLEGDLPGAQRHARGEGRAAARGLLIGRAASARSLRRWTSRAGLSSPAG